jgi:hypothetical protein
MTMSGVMMSTLGIITEERKQILSEQIMHGTNHGVTPEIVVVVATDIQLGD